MTNVLAIFWGMMSWRNNGIYFLELQVRLLDPQDYQPIANKIFEDIRQKFQPIIANANIQHVCFRYSRPTQT
jgi:hypothetical protein